MDGLTPSGGEHGVAVVDVDASSGKAPSGPGRRRLARLILAAGLGMLTAAIWQAKSWQREAAGLVERNRAEMAERGTSPGMLAPPPTPPSTDLIHKTDKPGRFQGMYESRLEREQVADFYRDWFAGQGYAMMPLERLAERGGWRFRRGSDTADLLFFAPRNETGAGCDFLLSSLSGAPAGQGAAATR